MPGVLCVVSVMGMCSARAVWPCALPGTTLPRKSAVASYRESYMLNCLEIAVHVFVMRCEPKVLPVLYCVYRMRYVLCAARAVRTV
eukprot:645224-Pyramimonas_sp.AAC.1